MLMGAMTQLMARLAQPLEFLSDILHDTAAFRH